MAYTPTEWQSGDIVTSAKLNKIEQGIADASGGGESEELYVFFDMGTGMGLYKMDLNSAEPSPVPVKYGEIANRAFIVMAEMYAVPCTCIQYGDTTYGLSGVMTSLIGTTGIITTYFSTGEPTDDVANITVESKQWTVSAVTP